MLGRLRVWLEDFAAADRRKTMGAVGLGVIMAWLPWSPDIQELGPLFHLSLGSAAVLAALGCGKLLMDEVATARHRRLLREEADRVEIEELTRRARGLPPSTPPGRGSVPLD